MYIRIYIHTHIGRPQLPALALIVEVLHINPPPPPPPPPPPTHMYYTHVHSVSLHICIVTDCHSTHMYRDRRPQPPVLALIGQVCRGKCSKVRTYQVSFALQQVSFDTCLVYADVLAHHKLPAFYKQVQIYMYVCVCTHTQRERERERERTIFKSLKSFHFAL